MSSSKPSPVARGPLPAVLLMLTVVTGLVDAVSYLRLGHVFVANMTGNVVFLGFGLAGAKDVNIAASLGAIFAFALGALGGGRLGARLGDDLARTLAVAACIGVVLVGSAALVAALVDPTVAASHDVLIALLGCAMGVQNAVARRAAIPDLTTTVLTMTITGLAADTSWGSGRRADPNRRLLSVAAMLGGAFVGGVLVLFVHVAAALAAAVALLAVSAIVSLRAMRAKV